MTQVMELCTLSTTEYDLHTQGLTGFVDLGDSINETPVVSEALVFRVVRLQGHWKTPITYFFIQSLTQDT